MHAFAMGYPLLEGSNAPLGVEFVWQNGDGVLRKTTFLGMWSRRQVNVILDFTVHRLKERIDRGRPSEESDVTQLCRAGVAAAHGHDQIIP
jgi:hypothetical protein